MDKRISLDKAKYNEVIDMISNFAIRREYVINEEDHESEKIFTIYDRKADSTWFSNTIATFVGNYLLNDRIRLTLKVLMSAENVEINVRGEVVMSDWNYVNDRPRRRDVVRCEMILEEMTKQLETLLP